MVASLSPAGTPRQRALSRWATGGLAALSALVLAACSSTGAPVVKTDSGEISELSIVVGAYPVLESSVPWIVGQEKGLFEDEGVKVLEIIGSAGGSSDIRNALAANVPIASVGTLAAAEARKSGIPVSAVAGPSRNLAMTYLVASEQSGIETLDDIRSAEGLKWGYTSPNSVTQSLMFLAIEELGLNEADVEQVGAGGSGEAATLLSGGELDVAFLPATLYVGKEDSYGALVATADEITPDYSWELLVTTEDILAEHHDVIVKILKGYAAAVDFVNANPSEAAALWAAKADLDPTIAELVLTSAVEAGEFGYGDISDAGWEAVDDSLKRNDVSDDVIAELFDNSIVEELGFTIPQKIKR